MTALPKQDPTPQTNPLTALGYLLRDDMAAVNQLIISRMQSDVPLIPQLAQYLIASGGKRIRPLLTVASGQLCNAPAMPTQLLATAVEFIHTASLLHDDVVDESIERRGQSSANIIFGNQACVLVGDFLFASAFRAMVDAGSMAALDILSAASAHITEGEVLQLKAQNDIELSQAAYLRVIEAKTARLFAAACEVPAVLADADMLQRGAMRDYGYHLGIAFQIIDDVLDYTAHSTQLGKEIGHDFREGTVTLPVILAYQAGNDNERQFWQRTMIDPTRQSAMDLSNAQMYLKRHNVVDACRAMAADHVEKAIHSLRSVTKASPMRELLIGVAEHAIARDH